MKISVIPIAWYLPQMLFFRFLSRWIRVHSPIETRAEFERISS